MDDVVSRHALSTQDEEGVDLNIPEEILLAAAAPIHSGAGIRRKCRIARCPPRARYQALGRGACDHWRRCDGLRSMR